MSSIGSKHVARKRHDQSGCLEISGKWIMSLPLESAPRHKPYSAMISRRFICRAVVCADARRCRLRNRRLFEKNYFFAVI